MRYKVGDKVRIRTDLIQGRHYNNENNSGLNIATSEMVDMKGQIVTIKDIVYNQYTLVEDSLDFHWTDEMFETLPQNMNSIADMLQNGMVVEFNDGTRWLFLNGYFMDDCVGLRLETYWDSDLIYNGSKHHSNTVKNIYTSSSNNLIDFFNKDNLLLYWTRKETPKEMTLEEIEKELGYSVKIIEKKELPYESLYDDLPF